MDRQTKDGVCQPIKQILNQEERERERVCESVHGTTKGTMGKGRKSGKVRFDGIDVAAMVAEMNSGLLGRRIINIYDGVSDADSFLFKLDGGNSSTEKAVLFMESGIRFHTTKHQASLQQEGMPSPFTSKLRKHLRGLRLEKVAQLGNFDRVVNFVFGTGESRHTIVLELYARGNLLMTDGNYKILALLRSHDYDEVQVKAGQVYPVTYATSITNESKGLLGMTDKEATKWFDGVLAPNGPETDQPNNGKSSSTSMPLKALLLKPSSGVHHYGPSLLEHCLLCANLDPMTKVVGGNVSASLPLEAVGKMLASLRDEGSQQLEALSGKGCPGYVFYREKHPKTNAAENDSNGKENEPGKVLEEFQPNLLKQHEGRLRMDFPTFAAAVDGFFANLGEQRRTLRAEAAENAAKERLEKVRKDQEGRVESLQAEQEKLRAQAKLVQIHADEVEKVLIVVNSALDNGMDWEGLDRLVEVEKENGNPVAMLIKRLNLKDNEVVLSLEDTYGDLFQHSKTNRADVTVSLSETAHSNARSMFDKYRAFKEKSEKTLENAEKAMKAAEANAKRQLAEAQRKTKLSVVVGGARKTHWFEKFHWFITSDNYLVLAGKDAHQNEMLVKRYLRPGDAYLHADVHGAASCVLRAKQRRMKNGKVKTLPLSDQALREAGSFTICRSSAWNSRMVTSAWWVEPHQVSKTAPTGEYLTVGSFMIRGKKNFLPPSQLEMGLAVVFRLGDDDSLHRHKNDRRDFALLNLEEEDDDDDDDEEKSQEERVGDSNKKKNGKGVGTTNSANNDNRGDASTGDNKTVKNDGNGNPHQDQSGLDQEEQNESSDWVVDTSIGETIAEKNTNDKTDIGTNASQVSGTEPRPVPTSPQDQEQPVETKQQQRMNECATPARKKKGLSVRERKPVKKYGSLEAAEAALEARKQTEKAKGDDNNSSMSVVSDTASLITSDSQASVQQSKRGRRGKLKKMAKKYADQDDEDRALALMALHGGEKRHRDDAEGNTTNDETGKDTLQSQAASQTAALLVKNPEEVAQEVLSKDLYALLSECITEDRVEAVNDGTSTSKTKTTPTKPNADVIADADEDSSSSIVVRWDKFDADIIEQLASLESEEQKETAVKRLRQLVMSSTVDNYSSSLSGIIRTIKKYGHESVSAQTKDNGNSTNNRNDGTMNGNGKDDQDWKDVLEEEGVVDRGDGTDEGDAVDDTAEISKLTGKPLPEDLLLYALPFCAPYQTLSQYKYRVKLTPGNLKKGKAAKQCLEMFYQSARGSSSKEASAPDNTVDFIKAVPDGEWAQSMMGDVKITAAGANKTVKRQKQGKQKQKQKQKKGKK